MPRKGVLRVMIAGRQRARLRLSLSNSYSTGAPSLDKSVAIIFKKHLLV